MLIHFVNFESYLLSLESLCPYTFISICIIKKTRNYFGCILYFPSSIARLETSVEYNCWYSVNFGNETKIFCWSFFGSSPEQKNSCFHWRECICVANGNISGIGIALLLNVVVSYVQAIFLCTIQRFCNKTLQEYPCLLNSQWNYTSHNYLWLERDLVRNSILMDDIAWKSYDRQPESFLISSKNFRNFQCKVKKNFSIPIFLQTFLNAVISTETKVKFLCSMKSVKRFMITSV